VPVAPVPAVESPGFGARWSTNLAYRRKEFAGDTDKHYEIHAINSDRHVCFSWVGNHTRISKFVRL